MADIFSKVVRSYIMSRIKSSNTKPEVLVRAYLYNNGFRFRKNVKNLSGSPDIVIKKIRTAIFINGCFWHGHENCKYFKMPKTRTEWWAEKIHGNSNRDIEAIAKLRKLGWNVIVIWECQLKPSRRNATLEGLLNVLYKFFLDSVRIPNKQILH